MRETGLDTDTHTERERREGAIEKDWRRKGGTPRRCPSINKSSVKTEEGYMGKSIESNPTTKNQKKEEANE